MNVVLRVLAVVVALWLPAARGQLVYDTEYPQIGYAKTPPADAYSKLMNRLAASGGKLAFDAEGHGYLDGLLQALGIDPSSQALIFSKTSLKQRYVAPALPRSLFFTDDVYVTFVPGTRSLEVAAMDPLQGPVFFDVSQDPKADKPYKQETDRCLRCHDTYSMTGGGVPRFLLSSVIAGPTGDLVSHELSDITDQATPIEQRFGGWYVTGMSGKQIHRGNFIVKDINELKQQPWVGKINQASLDGFVDLKAYPRKTSDIVALMVLQHQTEVQNRLVRLNYESRKLLAGKPQPADAVLQELIKPVLQVMFFADEPKYADALSGNSGYQQWFEQRGPKTADGKSLRQFDLKTRTFRYRLSYLIYSDAIAALAAPVKTLLFRDIQAVLGGDAKLLDGFVLPADERDTIKAILQATRPDVLAAK
ncbi:MAG TPA: hypothetical protein VMH83_04575 [Candidatus Acidoferrum sp.]|nr:hypothetical protein [Candidatus Acidoferrum sp.]